MKLNLNSYFGFMVLLVLTQFKENLFQAWTYYNQLTK